MGANVWGDAQARIPDRVQPFTEGIPMTDTAKLMELTRAQLRQALALMGTAKPPNSSPGRPMCALFLTMVEQFEATARLMEANLVTHAGVHVRGMMEALADFHSLHQSETHLDVMFYKQLQGEKRVYERAVDSKMLSPDDLAQMEARLTDCTARYQAQTMKLTKQQTRANAVDAFKAAGVPEFITPYTMLCSMAHSDLTTLAMRHQGERSMELRKDVPLQLKVLVHSMAHHALMHALPVMVGIAKFREGSFEHHFNQMVDIHGQLLHECDSEMRKAAQMGGLE